TESPRHKAKPSHGVHHSGNTNHPRVRGDVTDERPHQRDPDSEYTAYYRQVARQRNGRCLAVVRHYLPGAYGDREERECDRNHNYGGNRGLCRPGDNLGGSLRLLGGLRDRFDSDVRSGGERDGIDEGVETGLTEVPGLERVDDVRDPA